MSEETNNIIKVTSIKKNISKSSLPIDLNILKAPLFLYDHYRKPPKIFDKNGKEIETVEEKVFEWIDSKNLKRKLKMKATGKLPRQLESDVFYGLIGLFVKKHAPFMYDEDKKEYIIPADTLDFSWYELCEYMRVPSSGSMIKRLKDAIRILKQTQYYSYESGVFFDKMQKGYLVSDNEASISLIDGYMFKTRIKVEKDEKNEYSTTINNNYVVFTNLIINNLKSGYWKFLDNQILFELLPSGITRGIYSYLEANKYDNNYKPLKYIKRNYESLKIGIPVDFQYPSKLKIKINKALNTLVEVGYLKDYIYGDELDIFHEKEQCIYFCFGIQKQELINILNKNKYKQLNLFNCDDDVKIGEVKSKPILKLPKKSLYEELTDRKIDENFAREVLGKKNKWDIITCIMWADQRVSEKKVVSIGGILGFALRLESVGSLLDGYPEIAHFINTERQKEESKQKSSVAEIRKSYNEYISNEIEKFKMTSEYEIIRDVLLVDIDKNINRFIKEHKLANKDTSLLGEYVSKREKSQYFQDILVKEIKIVNNLMTEKEFIEKYKANLEKNDI